MGTSVMTHGVCSISHFEYDPSNNDVVSFVLNYKNGDKTTYHIWGLNPEGAEDFYTRNSCGSSGKDAEIDRLNKVIQDYKDAINTLMNTKG